MAGKLLQFALLFLVDVSLAGMFILILFLNILLLITFVYISILTCV